MMHSTHGGAQMYFQMRGDSHGECRCHYDSQLKYLMIDKPLRMYLEWLVAPIKISQPAHCQAQAKCLSMLCLIPSGTDKNNKGVHYLPKY